MCTLLYCNFSDSLVDWRTLEVTNFAVNNAVEVAVKREKIDINQDSGVPV